MMESVRGYSEAIRTVAEERGVRSSIVAAISRLKRAIDTSKDLREVLTDPSVPPKVKAEIVADLFGPSPDRLTVQLAQTIVMSESPKYIPDAVNDALEVLEIDDLSTYVGADSTKARALGFASALFAMGDAHDLERCEDELFKFARLAESSGPLRRALSGMGTHPRQRIEIVGDLLANRSSRLTLDIAKYASSISVIRDIVEILDDLVALAAAERDRFVCQLRSATPLTAEQIERIRQTLQERVGRTLEMRSATDPSLIAGVVAVVGDEIFDGSARHRIDQLRVRLSAKN